MFIRYYSTKENYLRKLPIEVYLPIPARLWAYVFKKYICRVPSSVDALLAPYLTNRDKLGLLAEPHEKAASDFLQQWSEGATSSIHVPRALPNSQIV